MSRKEANRYLELKLLERAGKISRLVLQPRFPVIVNGIKVTTVVLDFQYDDLERGGVVHEDVKGYDTPISRLKRKLILAAHGIEVVIV